MGDFTFVRRASAHASILHAALLALRLPSIMCVSCVCDIYLPILWDGL